MRAALSAPRRTCPLALTRVPAGFPSPADDYRDRDLDLHEHLVQHPAATFFMRASGNSMTGAGIHDGDLLIVDRSIPPRSGSVVIAILDGELTVKRLKHCGDRPYLTPENPEHAPIWIDEGSTFEVWGVVVYVVHKV